MGNQINILTSIRMAENSGFQGIRINQNENSIENKLRNIELTGKNLTSDPDQRDYFIKCPECRGLIADTGMYEKLQCDICKKIITLPENNFEEIKNNCLYNNESKKKSKACKAIKDFCSKLYYFLPFVQIAPIYALPTYKNICIYINEDKLNISAHAGKDFMEILNNIIIPFFQYKSRIVNKNKIFSLDGIEFKVVSIYPHYLTAKVTSKTAISCNNYYSYSRPINQATFITFKKRELEASEYIAQQIINTPYPIQLGIIEGINSRINTYDLVVRNCAPKYGIITQNTNVIVINRNIETLRTVTFAILHSETNQEFNDIQNKKLITNNYIKPYFYYGNQKYIERGDIINISGLKIFVLRAKPSTGFVIEDFTRLKYKFDSKLEECQLELNEQIENETLQRSRERNRNINRINIRINGNNIPILISNFPFQRRLIGLQERLRIINEILISRRNALINNNEDFPDSISINSNQLINDGNNLFNFGSHNINNIQRYKIESAIRSLPIFKIDKKFIEVSQKAEDSKNEQIDKCIICMEKFKIDEEVKTLPCFHIFHKECIDEWFKGNNYTCPICKNSIITGTQNDGSDFENNH